MKSEVSSFLISGLKLQLNPEKCTVVPLGRGVNLFGFRNFYHCRLVRRRNLRKIRARLAALLEARETGEISTEAVLGVLRGWSGYAMHGDTYALRRRLEAEIAARIRQTGGPARPGQSGRPGRPICAVP